MLQYNMSPPARRQAFEMVYHYYYYIRLMNKMNNKLCSIIYSINKLINHRLYTNIIIIITIIIIIIMMYDCYLLLYFVC